MLNTATATKFYRQLSTPLLRYRLEQLRGPDAAEPDAAAKIAIIENILRKRGE